MSENVKVLLEKRNALVEEGTKLLDNVEVENRSLEDTEKDRLTEIKAEVTKLDSTLNQIKEFRGLANAESIVEFKGEKKEMDKKETNKITSEVEVRGLEQYLRGQNGEERRALAEAETITLGNNVEDTAGNGGITVPEGVYSQIIEQLDEGSPVFAAARKFGSVTGNLRVAREDGEDDEGFIGETLDATKIRPVLKSVKLTQKRVGAAIQLTNQLINDSGVDIVGYANSRLTRSVAKAIERGILLGAKDPENADQVFQPIVGDANVHVNDFVADAPTIEDLLAMYTYIHPGYLDGAMWIVSRRVFNEIVKLKDGDGSYLVFRNIVEGKPGYTLFGAPIHVTSILEEETGGREVLFGNIGQAYGMLVKKNMNLITVTADTTQALAGGRLAILDAYMDGAVINPAALVIGRLKQ